MGTPEDVPIETEISKRTVTQETENSKGTVTEDEDVDCFPIGECWKLLKPPDDKMKEEPDMKLEEKKLNEAIQAKLEKIRTDGFLTESSAWTEKECLGCI